MINVKKLAEKYDGKYYLDLDMPDRIEAFKFTKTDKGLEGEYIGCDYCWGYQYNYVDEYTNCDYGDMYNGGCLEALEEDCEEKYGLFREITQEKYEEIKKIVLEQKGKTDKLKNDFIELQEKILELI